MNRKNRKKLKIIVPALLLVGVLAIGFTIAILTTTVKQLTNTFEVGEITTEIEEEPGITGSTIKKNPSVKNTGKSDSIIRMRVTISPNEIANDVNKDNDKDGENDITINYDTGNWLYNENDGFWYYQGIVPAGESTTPLFTEITGILDEEGKIKEKYADIGDFQITLYQEAVQSVAYDEAGNATAAYDVNGQYIQNMAMRVWEIYERQISVSAE